MEQNRKKFEEDVDMVRRAILDAIPTDIDYDAIIKALGQMIAMMIDSRRDDDA